RDLSNRTCLGCHAKEGFAAAGAGGKPRALHLVEERSAAGCTASATASSATPTSPRSRTSPA
ncbi:MAG: hypothetical protein WAO95_11200, partial [Burkholderiales bacterium]